jgi:hypothetical protein
MKPPTRGNIEMRTSTTFLSVLAMAAVAFPFQIVQAQSTPQRTITSSQASGAAAPGTPDTIDNMLQQYREMWGKMSPAQQKAFLDSGGSTPEQYERLIRTKGPSAASNGGPGRQSPADPRAAMNALDSLTTSLQDLNAIRDGNLTRVQKDGCPPEVAARLADLKARLAQDEAELSGVEAPVPAASQSKDRAGAADPLAIADDWYKRSPQTRLETANRGMGNPSERSGAPDPSDREARLLSGVLPGGTNTATPERRVDAQSPETLQRQKALEDEIARTKAEISQLSAACTAIKP